MGLKRVCVICCPDFKATWFVNTVSGCAVLVMVLCGKALKKTF